MPKQRKYNGDSLLHCEEDDILVCSQCGSPDVQTLAYVGVNDRFIDEDSIDFAAPHKNRCLECDSKAGLVHRRDFLKKMNRWWDSLPAQGKASIISRNPFAQHWRSLIYFEKCEIYVASRN